MDNSTVAKTLQVQFLLKYSSIEIKHKIPFNFKMLCRTSKTSQEDTKKVFEYKGIEEQTILLEEEASFVCTLQVREDNSIDDKMASILLQVYTKQGFKSAGKADINIASLLDNTPQTLRLETKNSLEKLIFNVEAGVRVLKESQSELNESFRVN